MSIKYKILRVRKNFPVPVFWNGLSQTDSKLKKMHGACLSDYWQLNLGDEYYSAYDEADWNKVAEKVADKIISDKNYVLNFYKEQKKFGKLLEKLSLNIRRLELDKLDYGELLSLYKKIEIAWVKHDQYNVYPWFLGGDIFQGKLKSRLLEAQILDKEIETLLTPPKLSFSSEEELEIFQAVVEIADNSKLLGEKARELSEKYYWVSFGYDGPSINDAEYYKKEIKEIIAKKSHGEIKRKIAELSEYRTMILAKQEKILRDFKIKNDLWRLVEISHVLTYMTDERKKYTYQAHEAFYRVILAIANKMNIDYKVLKFVTPQELVNNLKKPNILKKLAEKRMAGWFIIHWHKGECELIEGAKAKVMAENILLYTGDKNFLKGAVGSKGMGNVTGRVRIIWRPSENSKLKEGEVLVTGMTTPEFVPAMRKAIAIITDEGGITSHAAIVARELNKPCIIDTKIATKVLKDGDLVEIDVNKGEVKIIK